MTGPTDHAEARASASVATAWIILANKPVYPLYVWWFAGEGALASTATMLAAPLYAAVILLARRSGFAARLALPLVGLADTLFATKLFGAASGTELFLLPCALLAVLAFDENESRWSRGLAVAIGAIFAISHGRFGAPLYEWSAQSLVRLAEVNAYAVASLGVFIALRFPRGS
jgi:hypothetical protein